MYRYASRDPRVPWMLRSWRPVISCIEGFDRALHTAAPISPAAAKTKALLVSYRTLARMT